jgi:hypothetical protein
MEYMIAIHLAYRVKMLNASGYNNQTADAEANLDQYMKSNRVVRVWLYEGCEVKPK